MRVVDERAILELAIDSARRAGALLLDRFHEPARGVATKSTPTDLVSDADRDAEKVLVECVNEARPGDGIVGEESSARPSSTGITWVLDPLDGTVNFLFGIPVWCVSVAVVDDGGAIAGVVFDAARDEIFTAGRGDGTRRNGSVVHASRKEDLSTALVGTGFAYAPEARRVQAALLPSLLPVVRDIRRAGSAALDLAWVACGRLDGFYESAMQRWDTAAGTLLVQEAGGRVSELDAPIEGSSPGVVASGAALHDALRALVTR
jgi:myo-inositol-1(or 4)-monophosphatase